MAALKTQPTKESVTEFLAAIEDEQQRKDARKIAKMMREASGKKATMWGKNLVGYGRYDYEYASGQAGSWFRVGFAPRKRDLTLYIMPGFSGVKTLLGELGKHKVGKSCLYIKRLSDVDERVLRQLIDASLRVMADKYPEGA